LLLWATTIQNNTFHLLCSQKNNSKIEEILKNDVQLIEVDYLSNILITVLHQTLECLADNQWELRRMSKQVIPV
jgi:hypothetical protein